MIGLVFYVIPLVLQVLDLRKYDKNMISFLLRLSHNFLSLLTNFNFPLCLKITCISSHTTFSVLFVTLLVFLTILFFFSLIDFSFLFQFSRFHATNLSFFFSFVAFINPNLVPTTCYPEYFSVIFFILIFSYSFLM